MVATLKDSDGRMNDLLARLSQHQSGQVDEPSSVELLPLDERIALRRSGGHPVSVSGDRGALALADPARLELAVGHLIQNAVEASAGGEPVTVTVGRGSITVADGGTGMSATFIRDHLFRPFVSTKKGGFGSGAFEALQVIQAMGGTRDVASREGEGARFTIALPVAMTSPVLERAA